MTRWITGWSIGLRFLVLVLAGALLVYGVTQIRQMPVDVFPEFDPPLVEVQTEALGLSAAEMEALITVPLEADLLNGVAWLDQIYSESVVGLSSILLVFEPGTDPIRARQMVQERLTQTFALPNVSKPPTMLQPLSTTSRVLMVGLSSDEVSLTELGVLARWNIKPRLMGVPGVANVAIWGQRERQLQVLVDPEQLQDTGVTLQQVIETTGEALWVSPLSYLESSTPGTAGWIDTPNQRLSLRHQLPISSADDLAQVPVKGTAWRLADVAEVVEDHQPLIGEAILRDGPGLLLVVEKFPGANTLEVTRGVEAALDAMRPGLTGIEIDPTVFRPATYIEQSAGNLSSSLLIGAVLAIIVLAAFTLEWRAVLISLTAIAASLAAAVLVLYWRGASFNLMVLAGLTLALGVIVDDAVIGMEHVLRRLRERGDGQSAQQVISEALIEVRGPIGFATLIILLTATPIAFLPGLSRSFFAPLLVSYIIAILISLAVALLITPALCAVLLSGAAVRSTQSPLLRWLQRRYDRILNRTVRAAAPAFALAGALILAGLLAVPGLRTSLLPPLRQTELRIAWEGPPGTSRAEMARVAAEVSDELRAVPGVRNVGSHFGRAITGDQVVGINSGEVWVSLDPEADYTSTVAAIRGVISGYPGLFRATEPYLPERIGEALAGPDQDLVVRLYGHEYGVLRSKAEEVRQAMLAVDGLQQVQVQPIPEEPQVEIEVDLAAAERFQVKPGDVRRSATTLLSGLQVGNLYEENKVFDVIVWGVPEIRNSLTDVSQLLIDTPRGGHVQLEQVADIRIAPAPIVIRRDAVSRFIDVSASVQGRSLTSVLADVGRSLERIDFPLEYHAEVLSQSVEIQAARQRIVLVGAVALMGSFLLLQAAFSSWRLAWVAILTLPAALVGSVLGARLAGGIVSFGTVFGLLAVLAVAVRQAVSLIGRYQQLEWEHGQKFGRDLVLRGARQRLGPIAISALVLASVLLPLLVLGDAAGNELLRPMAVVILGGLLTAELWSLFILPPLYLRYGQVRAPEPAGGELRTEPEFSPSSD